ncbi:hypothetical protein PSEUDO9AG_60085 [Pseudomonas sp. 9Ag]|nr:hypothetical protein PSEUDO9AG_60085 [Pseudomonas sp. 9Ag]
MYDGAILCAVNKGLIYNVFSWWSAYESRSVSS